MKRENDQPSTILGKIKRMARDARKGIFRSREVITTDLGHGHTTHKLGPDPYEDEKELTETNEEDKKEKPEEPAPQQAQITITLPPASLQALNNLAINSGHTLKILMKNAVTLITVAYKVHEEGKELAIVSKDDEGTYTLETAISLTKPEGTNDE